MYIDMATLTTIPRRTGGEICYYPSFDPTIDGERLHFDLSRAVVQPAVYSAIFKIRVSKGLSVESMHATWDPEVIDSSTFTISRLSVDATVNFTLVPIWLYSYGKPPTKVSLGLSEFQLGS